MRKKIVSLLTMVTVSMVMLAGCGSGNTSSAPRDEATKPVVADTDSTKTENSGTDTAVQEAGDQGTAGDIIETDDGNTLLIAYFSRADENYNVGYVDKGNTAILAEMAAELTGGDLFEIKTVQEYPADYDECTDVAKQEQKENARPELAATVEDMDRYTVCILCYPIWWSDLPMPVYSFLDDYDWTGKTIITLNTHEGSGKAGTPEKISNYIPEATVVDGLAIQGQTAQNAQDEAREAVEEWLAGLGYKK